MGHLLCLVGEVSPGPYLQLAAVQGSGGARDCMVEDSEVQGFRVGSVSDLMELGVSELI